MFHIQHDLLFALDVVDVVFLGQTFLVHHLEGFKSFALARTHILLTTNSRSGVDQVHFGVASLSQHTNHIDVRNFNVLTECLTVALAESIHCVHRQ